MASDIKENQKLFIEEVLAHFSSRFSEPSSDILSVRCIRKNQLVKQLLLIRDEISFPGYKRISGKEILEHLKRSKLIRPIQTQEPNTDQVQDEFYLIGIESETILINPIELLQAYEPSGVICYFTALEFYGLTTQIPSHYTIAKLKSGGNKSGEFRAEQVEKKAQKDKNERSGSGRIFNPLGTEKFVFESVPYYVTNRDAVLVPGIQERFLDEKTRFRITTLEQTLLDTLHRPKSCGGVSVVFEAWETALEKVKENRILEYLLKINNIDLSRRTGYMMQSMDYEIGDDLTNYFNTIKNEIKKLDTDKNISLFSDLDYSNLDKDWLIRVP